MGNYITQAKAEIARLEKLLSDERQHKTLEAFALSVGNSIMVCLANVPFDQWPQIAITAFEHEARKQRVLAQKYKSNLPPKSDWWQP